jgi:hypothetical protein
LKQENSLLYNQIDSLQKQLALLVEDKIQLEHRNSFLSNQLKHTKQGLIGLIDNIYWEDPSDFTTNYTKDVNGLYTNVNLSFAAAAAAAAISEETTNQDNKLNTLSQAIAELESAQSQEKIEVSNITNQESIINSNKEQDSENLDLFNENELIDLEANDSNELLEVKHNTENSIEIKTNNDVKTDEVPHYKMHYGMIRSSEEESSAKVQNSTT